MRNTTYVVVVVRGGMIDVEICPYGSELHERDTERCLVGLRRTGEDPTGSAFPRASNARGSGLYTSASKAYSHLVRREPAGCSAPLQVPLQVVPDTSESK